MKMPREWEEIKIPTELPQQRKEAPTHKLRGTSGVGQGLSASDKISKSSLEENKQSQCLN